jgi:hypothetical protein
MITKDDLHDALDEWILDERERLGGRPTDSQIVAFLRGELEPAEAARVQALLAYYPELTPLLKERVGKDRAARKRTAMKVYAGAATLLSILLGTDTLQQRRKSIEPAVPSSHHEFNTLRARGPSGVYELQAGQRRHLITLVPSEPPRETPYDLEITRDSRVLWTARNVRPIEDVFIVDIPGQFLPPGAYTMSITANGVVSDRYSFRVRP